MPRAAESRARQRAQVKRCRVRVTARGHDVGIRHADRLVARYERPGDALLDISAGASPQQSATLGGTYAPAAVI